MLYWLVDHSTAILVILFGVAAALVVLWWTRRESRYGIALAAVAAVALLVLLLSLLIVTDRQRMVQIIEEMAAGVRAREPDRVLDHLAADFRYGGMNKASFAVLLKQHLGEVRALTVSDAEVEEVSRADRAGKVTFLFTAQTGSYGPVMRRCRLTFRLDDDGQWRVREAELLDPMTGEPVTR